MNRLGIDISSRVMIAENLEQIPRLSAKDSSGRNALWYLATYYGEQVTSLFVHVMRRDGGQHIFTEDIFGVNAIDQILKSENKQQKEVLAVLIKNNPKIIHRLTPNNLSSLASNNNEVVRQMLDFIRDQESAKIENSKKEVKFSERLNTTTEDKENVYDISGVNNNQKTVN